MRRLGISNYIHYISISWHVNSSSTRGGEGGATPSPPKGNMNLKNILLFIKNIKIDWLNILLFITLGLCVLGFIPIKNLDFRLGKQLLASMVLMSFVGIVFVRNVWIKLFLVWTVIRTFLGYNKFSYVTMNTIFIYIMFYQTLIQNIKQEHFNKVLNGICIITLIQVFWQILQVCGVWILINPITKMDFIFNYRDGLLMVTKPCASKAFTGLMSNTNMTGAALAMGLPAFFRKKWFPYSLMVWVGLLLSRCAGAILPSLVVTSLYLWLNHRKFFVPTMLFLVTGIVFYLLKFDKIESLLTGSGRLPVWKEIMERMVPKRPIIGWGVGQFKVFFPALQRTWNSDWSFIRWMQAHNEYLQVLVEQGAIGLGIVIGFIVGIFHKAFKHRSEIIKIAFLGILVALINSGFNFLMHLTIATLFIVWVVLFEKGVSYATQNR